MKTLNRIFKKRVKVSLRSIIGFILTANLTIITTACERVENPIDPKDLTTNKTTTSNTGTGSIMVTGTSLSVSENGTSDSFTITLGSQPSANVRICMISSDTTEAVINTGGSVLGPDAVCSTAGVEFTPSDWNVPKTVTVTGVNDSAIDGTVPFNVVTLPSISTDSDFAGIDPVDISGTTEDATISTGSVLVTGGPLSLDESGTSDSFTIVLDSAPAADVKICMLSDDTSEAVINISGDVTGPDAQCTTAGVLFTNLDWNIPKTVTVTGVNDTLIDGNRNFSIITLNSISSDPGFNGIDAVDVSGVTSDNDTGGGSVTVSGGPLSVSETGTTDSFTIVLNSQPAGNVKICLASSDTTEAAIIIGGDVLGSDADCVSARVEFTPLDWNIAKTVTVAGVDDANSDGDTGFTIITQSSISTDMDFDRIDPVDVGGTTADNDVSAGINVSPVSGISVNESGTTSSFGISITSQPQGLLKVCLESDTPAEAMVLVTGDVLGPDGDCPAARVEFNASNWFTAKTVFIQGVADSTIDADQSFTIVTGIVTADPVYGAINPPDVTGTNINMDTVQADSQYNPPSPAPGAFTSIIGAPGAVNIWAYDAGDVIATIPLPFTFNYMGSPYTDIHVSTKGMAEFGTSSLSWSNSNLYTTSSPNNILALWWDDLRLVYSSGPMGRIQYLIQGTAPNRVFIIEWNKVSPYGDSLGTTWATFQLRLYETTNVIEFVYDTAFFGGSYNYSASIGIKGEALMAPNYIDGLTGSSSVPGSSTLNVSTFPVSGTVITFTPY